VPPLRGNKKYECKSLANIEWQ